MKISEFVKPLRTLKWSGLCKELENFVMWVRALGRVQTSTFHYQATLETLHQQSYLMKSLAQQLRGFNQIWYSSVQVRHILNLPCRDRWEDAAALERLSGLSSCATVKYGGKLCVKELAADPPACRPLLTFAAYTTVCNMNNVLGRDKFYLWENGDPTWFDHLFLLFMFLSCCAVFV